MAVLGSEPGTWLALLPSGVALEGDRRALERLDGLEVAVFGAFAGPKTIRVERVAVRAANGVPAVDGVVAREEGGWVLVTEDGKRVGAPHLPERLRQPGLRVWLAGPLDRPPDASGVVVFPPP